MVGIFLEELLQIKTWSRCARFSSEIFAVIFLVKFRIKGSHFLALVFSRHFLSSKSRLIFLDD